MGPLQAITVGPNGVDISKFAREAEGFVFSVTDGERSARQIEDDHLDAILSADLVWLHAPNGYVGPSASLEIGHAVLAAVPVFSRVPVQDVTVREYVTVVLDPQEAVAAVAVALTPSAPLGRLQRYYHEVAEIRGYGSESAQDAMLLLTEEVGELARAIRKRLPVRRDGEPISNEAALELADVQLYILHLANVLDVDLAAAVSEKERRNRERFEQTMRAKAS